MIFALPSATTSCILQKLLCEFVNLMTKDFVIALRSKSHKSTAPFSNFRHPLKLGYLVSIPVMSWLLNRQA